MRFASVAIIVFGILALTALFFQFKPQQASGPELALAGPLVNQATPSTQASAEGETGPAQLPRIVLRDGQYASGERRLQVRQGDEVKLEILSDQAGELHLHGYDLVVQLKPGEVSVLEFSAIHSGRFEYELHGQSHSGHHGLGVIEVMP